MKRKKLKFKNCLSKVYKEIAINKYLDHPHITKLFDYFETKEEIYLVFEHVEHGELFELIRNKGNIEESTARKYFQQLVSALDYIHRSGITHRDLKPENILLDKENNIKLLDFGFSNMLKDGRCLHTACGSPNYAAPEVIHSKAYDGEKADIWSAGVVLFSLLEGTLPFDDGNNKGLFKLIEKAKYSFNHSLSYQVKDLINRMLQPNPLKRITMDEIKHHPWFRDNLEPYLFDYKFIYCDRNKEINEEVFDELCQLLPHLKENQEQAKEAILKKDVVDFCAVYNVLNHKHTMKQFTHVKSNQYKLRSKGSFKKKKLDKETIQELNMLGKNIDKYLDLPSPGEKEKENERVYSYSSMNTSTTLSPENTKKDDPCVTCKKKDFETPKEYSIGIKFTCDYRKMIEQVFTILKSYKIVWKKLNSDFVYKCHTGIPTENIKKLRDPEFVKNFNEKEMVKFFLHFAAIEQIPSKIQPAKEEKKEYLCSFILIKGHSVKFLEFVSKFKQSVEVGSEE